MESTKYTPVLDSMRRFFATGKTLDVNFRKEQVGKVVKLIDENSDALTDAIYRDLHRSKSESSMLELTLTKNEAIRCLHDLDSWAARSPVGWGIPQALDKAAYIHKDPLGLVLVISPWNYPVNLTLAPLIGALGAGNCVVLKPSEVARKMSALIAKLIPQYFPPELVRVVEGGVPETTELLKERFDHIFFTGAPSVGKVVMTAAAQHLTPVTLELGGKCPAIIDRNLGDLRVAAKRILWGKFINCGQTCIAPDYILCYQEDRDTLVKTIRKLLDEFYGRNPLQSNDYARIINKRHFDRLEALIDGGGGRVAIGGKSKDLELYIPPTVLVDVKMSDRIMQEEIFGPILPILTIKSTDDAVNLINQGSKPLSMYIFSNDEGTVNELLSRTSSGSVTVNDTILNLMLDTLPFGGVGTSGMGRYHGKYSFDTFTHEKAVLHRHLWGDSILWFRYHPLDAAKVWWGKLLCTARPLPDLAFLKFLLALVLGLLLGRFLSNNVTLTSSLS